MAHKLSPQTLSETDRRLVAAWAADCAERVLAVFETEAPTDDRARDAIARARAFARGELTAAEEIKRRFVAGRAAHSATHPAAIAAARSAAQAAGVAHMGAHALGAAAYAVKAVSLAHLNKLEEAPDEINWQLERLSPEQATALRRLPLLGENSSGPLGGGLLATGALGSTIREIQAALRHGEPDIPSTVDPSDLTLTEAARRELVTWASACVARLLPLFEAERPHDNRLREALEGARLFSLGELGIGPMRRLAFACHAAARDADSPEATAVARAVGQAAAVAHMGGHSREIARYTRKALTGQELERELAWQRAHVPESFSDYVYPQKADGTPREGKAQSTDVNWVS